MTELHSPPLARVALRGLCPNCGAGRLFEGWIAFAPQCEACGLDFSSFNVGDGAAAFLIFIVGGIVFAGIIIVSLAFNPPWWVHVLLWLPLTLILTLALLRVSKALLLASEYKNAAREGKVIK
jgi:uncharacterized protein (DUF983 family)